MFGMHAFLCTCHTLLILLYSMGQVHSQSSTTPQFSPFNSVSNELLALIFSHVQSVSAKVRLGRVCKRFHQCLHLDQSWKFNTELSVSHASVQSLLALIKHFPRFTSLKIDLRKPHNQLDAFVSAMQGQSHKFQLSVLDVCVCSQSAALESFLGIVSVQLRPFLSELHLRSAHSDRMAISLLQHSGRLRFVTLNMDGYKDYTEVLAALHNKPFIGLTLSSARSVPPFPIIRADNLAPVINAVPDHSLQQLSLINCLLDNHIHFFLTDLELDQGARESITHLAFVSDYSDWLPFIGRFITDQLPNLIRVSATQVHSTDDFKKGRYIDQIIEFLADQKNEASPPRLEFRIKRVRKDSSVAEFVRSSSRDWWNRINVGFGKEGIHLQPEKCPNKNHWQRTIRRRNVTALITYDKD